MSEDFDQKLADAYKKMDQHYERLDNKIDRNEEETSQKLGEISQSLQRINVLLSEKKGFENGFKWVMSGVVLVAIGMASWALVEIIQISKESALNKFKIESLMKARERESK